MIAAIVVVVLAVLVVTAIVWARVTSARSATKSVETYERALGVLGEVSKRTESTGFRILPHEETGRPHVGRRIDETGGEAPAARSAVRLPGKGQLASSRLPPAGEPKLRLSAPNRMPGHGPVADHQDGVDQEADLSDTGPGTTAGARGSHARPACARNSRGSCPERRLQVASRSSSPGYGPAGRDRYRSGRSSCGGGGRRDLPERWRRIGRQAHDDNYS